MIDSRSATSDEGAPAGAPSPFWGIDVPPRPSGRSNEPVEGSLDLLALVLVQMGLAVHEGA